MNIYMPLKKIDSRNKYLYNLYKSLKELNIDLTTDKNFWLEKNGNWDIILIHWPEHLPFIKKANLSFEKFQIERIKYFIKESKLISIYHNYEPHKRNKNYKFLYNHLYNNSDAIVHFSDFSIKYIKEKYQICNCLHYVVPHGDYLKNIAPINKNIAKKSLRLPVNKNTVISIGNVRNFSDFLMILSFKSIFIKNNFNFIYVGNLYNWLYSSFPWKLGLLIRHIIKFISRKFRKYIFNQKSFLLINRSVSDNELNTLCSASDIVLIAKANNLNSGNIALGFSFSKIVLGPENGNIGEILKSTKNPTYKKGNLNSVEIIEKCKNALDRKVGEMNKKFLIKNWNWNKIGNNFKNIFDSLI